MRRTYHKITAHYNAYYNGQVSLEDARTTIAKNHQDNYSEILDIFPLGTVESVKSESMKIERVLEKASLVIHKHSMNFKGIEKNPWIPRSYLMIGKARFYAHDYGIAKQTFKFIMGKYPKSESRHEAQLWIARVQIIEGDFDDARGNLGSLENNLRGEDVPEEVKKMYPLVFADFYIKQRNYTAAIPYLKEGIKLNKKKKIRSRLYFILGQINQKTENYKDAIESYKMVLKNNPPYSLDFNARINMAKCFQGQGESSKEIIAQLNKMLKDEKNKEYLDQIYYALAEVELKLKNENQAIDYLELSVEKSVNNNLQKAFSALKLADIYFAKNNYTFAQAYYDSTMMFLPKTYPDYEVLKNRKEILTELVTNILIVEQEDSLQNLASMSEGERNKLIDKIIQEEIDREQKAAEEERLRQESLQFLEENRQSMQSVTQGKSQKFYFYNPQTISYGFTEFQKKWGQRKLEDDWRISNKQTLDFGEASVDEEGNSTDSSSTKKLSKKSREYYTKDLPLTQALKDSSDNKIIDALYAMGFIYKEKLNDQPKAIESFERLLKRYPKTKHTAASYYFLHQLFDLKKDEGEADYYKKVLVKEYPESDYAKLLVDPDFFKKLQQDTEKAKDLYEKAYRMYQMDRYDKTIQYAGEALTKYPNEKVTLAQCALIKALAIGKTSDTASFVTALNFVVEHYEESESGDLAKRILERIKEIDLKKEMAQKAQDQKIQETEKAAEKAKLTSIFKSDKSITHMFVLVVDRKNTKSMEFQQQLTKHNEKFFATSHLTVSAIPLDADRILVGVSNFTNAEEALVYLNTLRRNNESAEMLKKVNKDYYLISQENYTKLYKTRNLEAYREFYKIEYSETEKL